MADLFRYIEHAFPVPTPTGSISGGIDTVYQQDLHEAAEGEEPGKAMREISDRFLRENFPSPVSDPFAWGAGYLAVRDRLSRAETITCETVRRTVAYVFDMTLDELARSDSFAADRDLLKDTVIAVKLVTGF